MSNELKTEDLEKKDNTLEKSDQYLTFILDKEEYGIDILSVVEIRGWEVPTHIPSAPTCVKGVINLRGNIIPVIDLRVRFNLPEIPYGASTVLIVLQVELTKQKKVLGIVVDGVSDVYSVQDSQIKPKPEICDTPGQAFISSLVTIKQEGGQDKLVIILNPECLLNLAELEKVRTATQEQGK